MRSNSSLLACLLALLLWAGQVVAQSTEVEVQLDGVPDEWNALLLESMDIQRFRSHPLLNRSLIERLRRKSEMQLRTALEPFGHYQASVTSTLKAEEEHFLVRYQVNVGPPLPVASVDIQLLGPGKEQPQFLRWLAAFPLKPGDTLRHKTYEDAKGALLRLAQELGYLDASLPIHELRIDLDAYQAAVVLHMDSGPRYRFGKVIFHQDTFDEEFLQRFVPFSTGEDYNIDQMLIFQRDLTNSDYFNLIDMQPALEQTSGLYVPLNVKLEPRRPIRYKYGLGYGTDTGPRIKFGAERRYLNPQGHRVSADVLWSPVRASTEARYTIPLEKPSTDHLSFGIGRVRETTDTAERVTSTVETDAIHKIGKWQRTLGLSYQWESYNVGGRANNIRLLIPSMTWEWLNADDRINTSQGWRLYAGLKGGSKSFASDITFSQLTGGIKYIHGLGRSGKAILRSSAGTTWVSKFETLPVSLRFFAGGDYSVRGYAYHSLGPTDSTGQVIGGKYLLINSAEYNHRISDKFALAVFYDAGNASDDISFDLMHGAGVGLRWILPFGTVSLDAANAISDPDRPWRFHLTIGPDL